VSKPFVNPALVALGRSQAPLTVSQLTVQLRQLLEQRYPQVTVIGELSGLRVHNGHCYLCLKDNRSQLQAMIWSREYRALKVRLEDGMQVVARGRLTVYEPQGRYQLTVDHIEPVGAGALQAAFEQTKAKLLAEGLFAPEKKRPLALVPSTVAVVTSPTGAVIRDIVNVASRRYPRARILVIPSKVNGADSAAWIAAAVKRASRLAEPLGISVIIVARGGGSLEDLWGFNDERVARAIAAAPVPVVSGVGHETDTTIADFAADLRAPTPSAAAELVFPLASVLAERLAKPMVRMSRALRRDVTRERRRVDAATNHLRQVAFARCRDERLALQRFESRIARLHPRAKLTATRAELSRSESRIATSTRRRLAATRGDMQRLEQSLATRTRAVVELHRARLAEVAARLHALSPLAVLDRGFALVRKPGGPVVRDARDVAVGDHLDIRVARGQIQARVERLLPGDDEDA
jgi:exodeoxyribonuclease VII large subunit